MIKRLQIFIILIFSLLVTQPLLAKEDCTCPKVNCGPCQKKVNIGKVVKFCDWGDINVCRKVVCENVNFYFQCLTKYNKDKEEGKGDEPKADLELAYEQGASAKDGKKKGSGLRQPAQAKSEPVDLSVKPNARDLASEKVFGDQKDKEFELETPGRILVEDESRVVIGPEYSDKTSGKVSQASSTLKRMHRGHLESLKSSQELFVGDEIINDSGKDQKLSLEFETGVAHLTLAGKSKILVQDPFSIEGRFQPFFYLVHGGVKLDVTMKENSSFDLLAGQVLAQAQSGKHWIQYEMGQSGLQVRVEAQTAPLSVLRAQDLSGQKIQVQAGSFVSWVSETPKELFNIDEKMALADEGFITPVFQLSQAKRKQLGLIPDEPEPLFEKWKEPDGPGRDLASMTMTGEICQQPAAKFQQCAWSCENNPKGSKTCAAENPGTNCVRRVCNAAGQWGVPTAFASSYKDLCPSSGTRVGDCSP